MFGNAYFGSAYFGDTYWGPAEATEDLLGGGKDGKLSKAEVAGLKVIYDKKIPHDEEIVSILESQESQVMPEVVEIPHDLVVELGQEVIESQVIPTIEDKLEFEDDIGLILAIIEAHEN